MSYELFDINLELEKWGKKREELAAWLQANTIDHPDFEAKFREQNNVLIKINQLNRRKENGKGHAPKIYSLPKTRNLNSI